jgi:hypothetical protein
MRQRKRILVGTTEIGRHLYDLADGFRRLGHHVDTAAGWRNPQQPNLRYDFNPSHALFPDESIRQRHPLIRYPLRVLNLGAQLLQLPYFLNAYDVYVFQFGGSLWPGNRDYPLLKRLRKKMICIFCGDDIRHWSAAGPAWKSFDVPFPTAFYRAVETASGIGLRHKLTTLRMAERYADVILAQPLYAELALRPYHHLYVAVNLELYTCCIPGRDVPVLVHAPSDRGTKGTQEILAALESLRSEGVAFELRLLEGLSNREVVRQLVEADVVVDQLFAPMYGFLALEGMACGCVVACGSHPECVPLPPDRPVVPITAKTVYPQLKRLLTDKELRLRLAQASRPFVERYHDHVKVARNMLQCLELPQESGEDYHPTFFARHYRLPEGITLPDSLKQLTAQVVTRWGLPDGVAPQDLVDRGLMAPLTSKAR